MDRLEKFMRPKQTRDGLEPRLACHRLPGADPLSHRQGTIQSHSLLELHRSRSEAEAAFAFQRGARQYSR
jgi:hypothetical protein